VHEPADPRRAAARRGGQFPEGEIARFIDGRFTISAHGSRDTPPGGAFRGFDPGIRDRRGGLAQAIPSLIEYLKSSQRKH